MQSKSKIVLLSGSARYDGQTASLIRELAHYVDFKHINLLDYQIGHYDYEHHNRDDDFLSLFKSVLPHQLILLVTPVYWYSMSGIMKVFVDRMSDLVTIEKDMGRQLEDKDMAVLTSSYGNHLGDDFWHPFQHTANYLDMNYVGHLHTIAETDYSKDLCTFAAQLQSQIKN